MESRVRTRVTPGAEFIWSGGLPPSFSPLLAEYFMESRDPSFRVYGENQCKHYKSYAGLASYSDRVYTGSGMISESIDTLRGNVHLMLLEFSRERSLNWAKLPTSSQFGLIQLLAEIDESIVTLARLLIRRLSVGDVAYGLLPLISDLKAILKSIVKVYNFTGRYEDSQKIEISRDFEITQGTQLIRRSYLLTGSYRLSGRIVIPDVPINMVLDWIGFHPDLATVWDLVPLSFLVNYIIPVGDFLEGFRQGWVKAVYFSGFQSYDLRLDTTDLGLSDTNGLYSWSWSRYGLVYSRANFSSVLEVPIYDFDISLSLSKAIRAFLTYFARNIRFKF